MPTVKGHPPTMEERAMDGLSGALQRIGEIQTQLSTLTPAAAPTGVSFAQALSSATDRTGQPAATSPAAPTVTQPSSAVWDRGIAVPAGAGAAARLTASGVPVELARYGNGRVPADALQTIGHGAHRLWAPAARAFTAMAAAAARDGVHLGVTDSYRAYDAQVDLARRKGLYSQGGLAARPGASDHGWGRSLDLDLNATAQRWIRAHGPEYGYVEDVPREPWHWTFSPPA